MMTDPIADMLTRIRNAQRVHKSNVLIPMSKTKKALADLLLKEGYVNAVSVSEGTKPVLEIELKYVGGKAAIQSITRDSKPGHRMYRKAHELPRILNDYGIAVVSTSEGLVTNKEAREKGIGGEIVCSVY